jgi:hypothetical protein
VIYYKTVFILGSSFLVTMMDGSLVAQVGFEVVWMNIDCINVCVALYWIVGGCHPWLLSFSGGTMILR